MAKQAQRPTLEIVSPVAVYRDIEPPVYRHAPRPRAIDGRTIVLLPSEKSSSPPFVEALAQRLAAETRVKRAYVHYPDWAFFHPERAVNIGPEADRVARECDLMVSAVAY
jgi:hypothetical protein